MKTRRRAMLLGAGAIAGFAMPGARAGQKKFKLGTDWTDDMPGLTASGNRLAQSITAISDGRLKVTVSPANTLVRAFETFDAVSAGVADMYHTDEVYFQTKSPALNFFAAVPYGLTADELSSWILFGGGQALWDEVEAPFNI